MSIPSRNVTFNKPAEPSFLKAFKAKVGYKEPVGIEAKRPAPPQLESSGDGEEVEREDELPTVVVLRQGDISEQEFLENRQRMKDVNAEAAPTVRPRPSSEGDQASPIDDSGEGRIRFKKPAKRSGGGEERGGVLDASTSSSSSSSSNKKSKTEESPRESAATVVVGGVTRRRRRSSGGESKSRKVKNSSLLSFGDDEEEGD